MKVEQEDIQKKIATFDSELRQIRPKLLKANRDHSDWQLKVALVENELIAIKKEYERKLSAISSGIPAIEKGIREIDTRVTNLPSSPSKTEAIQEQMTLLAELDRRRTRLSKLKAERDQKLAELEKKRVGDADGVCKAKKSLNSWTQAIEETKRKLDEQEETLKRNQHCQNQVEQAREYSETELWKTPERLRDFETRMARLERKIRKTDGVLKVTTCSYQFKGGTYFSSDWYIMDLVRGDDFAGIVGTNCGRSARVRRHSSFNNSWVIGAWLPANCSNITFDVIFVDGLANAYQQRWRDSRGKRLSPVEGGSYCSDGMPFTKRR